MSPKSRARVYCAGRAEGLGCKCRGTFLDVYEGQIQWYLETFEIPEDYREKILEAHRKLQSTYDGEKTRVSLEGRLTHLKNLYEWGDIDQGEYQAKWDTIEQELKTLTPVQTMDENLDSFAHFLANVAEAWKEATQEQRNKLAKCLFEQIWIESSKVVAVKPRPELEPFFKINFERHARDIGCDPEGI